MAETKKQSRPVKPTANPQGVRFTYGTPVDLASLGDRLTISNRLAAGKFKLEAHYPAKQFNNKAEYINKRKEGSYCRFYDNKSPYFIARTVWDADRMPGIHMKAKNKFGETYTFVVTPKLDDATKVTILGGYVIPTTDGPVLCTGAIGELEAVGDDGDFKVVTYDKPNIRCPKSATGKVPTSMEYVKRPSKPRKTAADYCKPKHSFKHPTDIRAAEMVGEMADWIDEGTECYSCGWEGTIGELGIETDPEDYTMPIMVCPLCGEDEWLSDLFEAEAGEYDEPCFSCDGMGAEGDEDCSYCEGSGLMSETLKADLAAFDSEYFDAECGCWKGLESEDEDEEYYGEMYDAEVESTEVPLTDWANYEGELPERYPHRQPRPGSRLGRTSPITGPDFGAYRKEKRRRLIARSPTLTVAKVEPDSKIPTFNRITFENGIVAGYPKSKNAKVGDKFVVSSQDGRFPHIMDAEAKKELSFMDWAKQEEASHLKKYGAAEYDFEFDDHKAMYEESKNAEYDFQNTAIHTVIADNENEALSYIIGADRDDPDQWPDEEWEVVDIREDETFDAEKNCGCGKDPCITYGAEGHDECQDAHLDGIDFLEWSEEAEGPDCYITGLPNPDGDIEGEDNICEPCMSKWIYDEDGPEGEGYYRAKVLEAPLAGAGSTMDIAKDTDLGSFTSKELTESSAISGDFDHASLNYSGHQNIEARAEDKSFGWLKTVGVVSAFAAGVISAKKIIEIGDDE